MKAYMKSIVLLVFAAVTAIAVAQTNQQAELVPQPYYGKVAQELFPNMTFEGASDEL